uniref:Choline/carnitine acyltransferase domain-containing protein n=1 Tax=Timema monikensis TaxID=170555 RepID=A0A7R9HL75_9NEOP|nr:unnamed protein product [Timema monikensis]
MQQRRTELKGPSRKLLCFKNQFSPTLFTSPPPFSHPELQGLPPLKNPTYCDPCLPASPLKSSEHRMLLSTDPIKTHIRCLNDKKLQKRLLSLGLDTSPSSCPFLTVKQHALFRRSEPRSLSTTFMERVTEVTARKSVKPFLNATELQVTQDIVREFGSDSGLGRKLQRLLEDRASRTDNWVWRVEKCLKKTILRPYWDSNPDLPSIGSPVYCGSDGLYHSATTNADYSLVKLTGWWLKHAYLSSRRPIVVHSNPGIQLPHQSFERQEAQLSYATRFIQGALSFKKILDDVTILDENIRALDENQLLSQLRFVVEESPRPTKTVGILTSENRDTWAKYHRLLSQDAYNMKLLDVIEKSLFVLCLDGPAPDLGVTDKQSISGLQMVHGGGSRANSGNRWFDKALQLVVGSSGEVGCCYEHSFSEGGPVAYLLNYIYEYIGKHPQDLNYSLPTVTFPVPLKLEFKLTPEVEQGIETACKNLDNVRNIQERGKTNVPRFPRLVADFEMYCSTFPAFGKDVLKSFKVSPDSFIQMAIQLAFYRLHKVPGAHYESAGLRKFIHGRTETIRSCSQESVDFAMKMLSSTATNEEKYEALLAAINGHKNYVIECVNGHGVDRHLLGLKLIAVENGLEIPALFKDPAYIRSTHFRMSTSQVPMRCDGVLSFGPLVPDRYTICYNPRNLNINFSISAFRSNPETNAKKFQEALYKSLQDMHDVAAHTHL